jgi:ELWxxDGT repeat protein
MKKSFTLLLLFVSVFTNGQNPKKIVEIPVSSTYTSWSCNGLQFYTTYVEATNRIQIWRTDGTASGTFPVTSFTGTRSANADRNNAAVVGNYFYFTCINNGVYELWKSDGTVAGTAQVNISPLTSTGGLIRANSTHVFLTSNSPFEDLYSLDNTGEVTFLKRLKNPGAYHVLYDHATIFKDKLVVVQSVFNAQGNATNDNTFFITDGTLSGSATNQEILNTLPGKLIPCGDEYVLMELVSFGIPVALAKLPGLSNGIGNLEIFYTLGSGDNLKEYKTHPSGTYNTNGILTWNGNASIGNTIFLSGFSDNHGWELWKTDGTTAGTVLVKDIYPGIGSGFNTWNGFTINGKFIFDGRSPAGASRIYYSDGTESGTAFFLQAPAGLGEVVNYSNNIAYFPALTSTGSGISSIWQTDGTVENTLPVTPYYMPPAGWAPFGQIGTGSIIYPAYVNDKWQLSEINSNFKLWNGSADNDWSNTANWQGSTLPTQSDNILIPANIPNYPLLNSNYSINSLWLNWGNVTLGNNAELTLNGELSVATNNINLSVNNMLTGTGSVNFSGNSNHVFDGAGTITIPVNITGGDVTVSGGNKTIPQLNFQSASKLILGDNDLRITQSSGISGHASDRFIVTNGNGYLYLPSIGNGQPSNSVLFPIGNSATSYTPVTVSKTGNAGAWNVRVMNNAFDSYNTTYPETGSSSALATNAIDKTWLINVNSGDGSNASVTFQWNSSDELPGFNRSVMKARRYSAGSWTNSSQSPATGSNPYNFTYNNVPGFSPFNLISDAVQTVYYFDTDLDGYGHPLLSILAYSPPPGYVNNNSDCNDFNPTAYPGATETQNSIDDNCDGQVDEGLITSNQFIYLKGNATEFAIGSYGTQGLASVGNNPGKRRYQTTWQYNGKMYLFGGEGYASNNGTPPPGGYINDLWEYDPVTNNWRWLKGTSTLGGAAVYGTKGVASATNTPGARKNGMGWVVNNKFYLFGGYNGGRLCDLWEYDPSTNNWTWIAGNNSSNSAGVYGTLGVADAANLPAGREQAATWTYNGKLYLFGGIRSDGVNDVTMSDLWEYNFSTGYWAWINGSNLTNQFGVYGTQGVASASNIPGSRYESGFSNIGSKVYIFGGTGRGVSPSGGVLNDVWEYDNVTGLWTWLHGSTTNDAPKVTGTQGTYAAGNTPGARSGTVMSADNSSVYLYGGFTWFLPGGFHSDLWQYNPATNQWRSVKGNTTTGTLGIYGYENVEASTNLPGARGQQSLVTIGSALYMFGGRGYSGISSASDEHQNDLWKFNTSNNNWTWLKGASGKQYFGEYGTKGFATPPNKPGSKVAASSIGTNGKFYLFGGSGNNNYPNGGTSNEFWEYDPVSGNWKWLKGSNTAGSAGNYGTKGVSSFNNEPPFRTSAMMWSIGNKIYMFGGTVGANYNDLWEYDITTFNWTWLKGSNTYNQSGVYGTKGVAASTNTPGARWQASAFTYNNILYLFGGNGYNSGATSGELNDLWEYDPATNNWTWLSGNDAINSFGVYGTINVAAPANIPGARETGQMHTIGTKAYLFGGRGFASAGGFQNLNDTWEYDFATNQWTWKKGPSTGGNAGVAGSYGIEDPANYPIARYHATSWALSGKLYVFSGTPFGPEYNDLWEYNPATNNWRYIKGKGNLGNTPANYGLQGVAHHNNLPSIRWQGTAATAGGNAYIFGGIGGFANAIWPNTGSYMNDLWKWVPGPVFFYGNERKLYVNDNSQTGDIQQRLVRIIIRARHLHH